MDSSVVDGDEQEQARYRDEEHMDDTNNICNHVHVATGEVDDANMISGVGEAAANEEGEVVGGDTQTPAGTTDGDSRSSYDSEGGVHMPPPCEEKSSIRRTVHDLEVEVAQQGKTVRKGTVSKVSNSCTSAAAAASETRPGAVAMAGRLRVGDESNTPMLARNRNYQLQDDTVNEETEGQSSLQRSESETTRHSYPRIQSSSDPRHLEEDDTDCCQREHYAAAAAAAAAAADDIPMIRADLADEVPTPTIRAEVATTSSSSSIMAQEYEAPLIQAELVPPPVEAYRVEHVQIDEDAQAAPVFPNGADIALRIHNDGDDADERTASSSTKLRKFWTLHRKRIMRCQFGLLVVGLVLGIIVPRLLQKTGTFLQDENNYVVRPPPPVPSSPTPAPSDLSAHHCYDSTLEIAMAQKEPLTPDARKRDFVICANTKIPLGRLAQPEEDNDSFRVVDGDYPLTALTDSVEIRCGSDGRRENQCILQGGFVQVLLHPSLPGKLSTTSVNRTDNVVFRGITFTGDLENPNDDDGGPDSSSMIGGISVFANNPGQNITFVDCAWENMTVPRGLAHIGDKNNPWGFAPTMDVTFENCSFSNIVYGGGPMIGVFGQGVSLQRCQFRNLTLLPPQTSQSPQHQQDQEQDQPSSACPHGKMKWCQGILYCFERSVCDVEDICVHDAEFAGPAALAVTSYRTNLTLSGSKTIFGLVNSQQPNNTIVSSRTAATAFLEDCSTGLATFADQDYQIPVCLDDSTNWTTTSYSDSCVL